MLTSRNNNKAVWAVEYTKWQYHLSSITKSNHLLIYITIPKDMFQLNLPDLMITNLLVRT